MSYIKTTIDTIDKEIAILDDAQSKLMFIKLKELPKSPLTNCGDRYIGDQIERLNKSLGDMSVRLEFCSNKLKVMKQTLLRDD